MSDQGSPDQRRPNSPALDAVLGREFPVLDHGFIRVIDYMGGDDAIVQAARVSYGKGTKTMNDDATLIRYLLRHSHTTPFEMCEIKIHVKLPIFVARQWIRHRTASVNEYSGRYSVMDSDYYLPERSAIAAQSSQNKQGRDASLSDEQSAEAIALMRDDAEKAYEHYLYLLGDGEKENGPAIARELARLGLGVNFYTQWYWKTNLHNLMNFLRLRADAHAQFEIRQYANVLLDIFRLWTPITYQAFLDYRSNAVNLSAAAVRVLKLRLANEPYDKEAMGLSRREWLELQAIFGDLGFDK